jgi:hypothetical protein
VIVVSIFLYLYQHEPKPTTYEKTHFNLSFSSAGAFRDSPGEETEDRMEIRRGIACGFL